MRSKKKGEKLEVRSEKGRQDESFSLQDSQFLIPRLRFPEFWNEPSWPQHQLGDNAVILKGKGISKADLDPTGPQPCIRYGELYTRYSETISEVISRTKIPASELFLSKLDDVIIPSSGETKIDIAKASCVLVNDIALGGDLNVIRSKLNGTFLSYYLNGPKRFDIAKVAQGDTVVHLYPNQLKALQVAVPSQPEQQKIAECLSSVDEAIAAQARKLDALKTHKKGLMQQLFPRVGETQPCLRFPEFRGKGEWVLNSVGGLVEANCLFPPKDGNHGSIHPKSSDYVAKGIPFIMASDLSGGLIDIDHCHFISKELADTLQKGFAREGDVLLSHKGTVGEVAVVRKINTPYLMLTPQVTYYRVKDPKKLSSEFLAQLFVSETFQSNLLEVSGGGTRAYIGITKQAKLRVQLPKDVIEQQRIATCLTTLDDLITAETQKLEALKTHKRGLMQQLFPSPEEVKA